MDRSTPGYILFAILVTGFSLLGISAQKSNESRDAQRQGLAREQLENPSLQTEDVDFTGARVLGHIAQTPGKNPQLYRLWTGIETKDWLFLNGQTGAQTCKKPLELFARQLPEVHLSPASLDVALSALEGRKATIGMYVPLFKKEPDLQDCLGYRYDTFSRALKVGNRTVAFLGADQPGMALASR